MQDRLDAALDAYALLKHAHPLGGLPTSPQGIVIGNPDLREEARGMKLRQDCGVDLVGLDPGIGDRPNQPRIGDRNTLYVRSDQAFDRSAVARGFDDDLVFEAERSGKLDDTTVDQINPQLLLDLTVPKNCHLGEGPMDIHADDTHAPSSS